MPYRHMYIGPAAYSWGDIINIEIKILIHTGLQAERTYNSRIIMFLCSFYVFLPHFEYFLKQRLAQCCGVMPANRVFGSELVFGQGNLLRGRKPYVPVKAGLKAP